MKSYFWSLKRTLFIAAAISCFLFNFTPATAATREVSLKNNTGSNVLFWASTYDSDWTCTGVTNRSNGNTNKSKKAAPQQTATVSITIPQSTTPAYQIFIFADNNQDNNYQTRCAYLGKLAHDTPPDLNFEIDWKEGSGFYCDHIK